MAPLYLTPTRYRESGTGVDLSEKTDAELLTVLRSASALINQFCATPVNHDFRGGTVANERHRWRVGNVHQVPIQRVWPRHRPVRSVETLTIDITNTWSLALNSDKLYVNPDEGWIEPIGWPYTTYGFIAPLGTLPVGLRAPVARVDYAYGWQFAVEDEELTSVSGGGLEAANQFWITDEDIVIKDNGTVMPSGYTVDATEGTVTIASFNSSHTYTASYVYPLPSGIAMATALVANDLIGQSSIAAAGMLGLSGIRVEEIELRQSSKVNFYVTPINAAAQLYLREYQNWNWGGP